MRFYLFLACVSSLLLSCTAVEWALPEATPPIRERVVDVGVLRCEPWSFVTIEFRGVNRIYALTRNESPRYSQQTQYFESEATSRFVPYYERENLRRSLLPVLGQESADDVDRSYTKWVQEGLEMCREARERPDIQILYETNPLSFVFPLVASTLIVFGLRMAFAVREDKRAVRWMARRILYWSALWMLAAPAAFAAILYITSKSGGSFSKTPPEIFADVQRQFTYGVIFLLCVLFAGIGAILVWLVKQPKIRTIGYIVVVTAGLLSMTMAVAQYREP